MIVRLTQSWSRVMIVCVVLCALDGCSVTRKGASLDSTSRMPFFNMELAPKRKEPAPETQRIRWDHATSVETEPAKLTANTPTGDSKSWWQRLTGTERKALVPLPRTDIRESAAAPATSLEFPTVDAPVDF